MRRNPVGIFGIHAGEDVNNYRCSHPLPAEAAIPAVLSPPIAHSHATFQGHTGRIKSAVFSPDGRRVLTACGDSTARLWKAESGKLLAAFQSHTSRVSSAIFSADGRRVHRLSRQQRAALVPVTGRCSSTGVVR